jgi:hypothetical protein
MASSFAVLVDRLGARNHEDAEMFVAVVIVETEKLLEF